MGNAATPAPDRTLPAQALLVADSFRVRTRGGVAEVRGLAHHLARFRASVIAATPASTSSDAAAVESSEGEIDSFIASVLPRIAAAGEGFPRLELWRDAEPTQSPASTALGVHALSLALALRPLPTLRDDIALTSTELPGEVTHPEVKGPNITTYSALAAGLGGEALLLDEAGQSIEGTTTSLVWWHADGTGGIAAAPNRVPSVTEHLVRLIAHDLGDTISPEHRTPLELTKLEVWAVNALHGIRPVVSIDGQTPALHDPDRLARYRAALDRTWDPVRAECE